MAVDETAKVSTGLQEARGYWDRGGGVHERSNRPIHHHDGAVWKYAHPSALTQLVHPLIDTTSNVGCVGACAATWARPGASTQITTSARCATVLMASLGLPSASSAENRVDPAPVHANHDSSRRRFAS